MFDVLICGGLVIDGSGAPARPADIGIRGEVIESVGRLDGAEAARIINAADLVVAPGFIDTHVHSDVMILADPQHAPKLCQGVTTEILGQDGLSYAPLSPANLQLYRRYLAGLNGNPDIAWDWSSVAEFRSRFERKVAINTAYLIPHGTVRLEVLGMRDVPLQGEALKKAQRLIEQGMEEWAVGFSTGLSYYPCSYSDTDELVELCRTVAGRQGVFVIHTRTVFRGAPYDPVEEALEVARRSDVKLHFSHFRTHPATAGRPDELLAPVDAAQAQGVDVTLETYPYPSGSSKVIMFLPMWAQEGGPDEILARLADPIQRRRIVAQMPNAIVPSRGITWKDYVYSHIPSAKNRDLVGLDFVEAARRRGVGTPEELICDLLLEENLEVGFRGAPPAPEVWDTMNRDLMQLYSRPNYTVGSDSILVGDKPHPRAYGCFPRLLGRLRRQYGGPTLEALINRATALPAQRFGLKDRGLLQPGKAADVVIFNPDTLTDTATYEDPKRFPVGVEYVLVNGQIAVEQGRPTGVLAGRTLP